MEPIETPVIPYDPEAASYDAEIQQISSAAPDAVALIAFDEGAQLLKGLIEAGIDCIEHGTGLSLDLIDTMAANGVALVPTVRQLENFPTYAAAGDTIQTQADGRAVVQMIDGSVLSVRPNSTVVIRDNSSLFGGRNVRVALDDGQLNVRTDQTDGENVVEMLESETRLRPETDASFNADPRANGGEIRISRGGVETSIGGEKTTIRENEFASLNNGKITAREKLLTPPTPVSPANSAQVSDGGRGANVVFTWQDAEGVHMSSGEPGGLQQLETQDTQGGVMPSIAPTADGATVYLSWYDPEWQDLLLGDPSEQLHA